MRQGRREWEKEKDGVQGTGGGGGSWATIQKINVDKYNKRVSE